MLKKRLSILFILLIIILPKDVFSFENRIILKIDNEIITSIDILDETRYLKALNKNLQNISKDDIYKISLNSIIREKIKKIEILNNIKTIKIDETYLNQIIKTTYKKLNLKDKNEFKKYLNNFNVELKTIEDKITIETLWNELIYTKFFNKVVIDKIYLRKIIEEKKQKKIKSFLLSEIVFNKKKDQTINQTFNEIVADINNKGFENAASIHSISSTSNIGGDLGWINEDTINKKLRDELTNTKVNKHTQPITIPGGLLILKINNIKEIENEINVEKKLNEIVQSETNQQLNQFSNIYYNKVKNNIKINEL
jgi:peptidyl-prolyl cis-trans isomerase SurA